MAINQKWGFYICTTSYPNVFWAYLSSRLQQFISPLQFSHKGQVFTVVCCLQHSLAVQILHVHLNSSLDLYIILAADESQVSPPKYITTLVDELQSCPTKEFQSWPVQKSINQRNIVVFTWAPVSAALCWSMSSILVFAALCWVNVLHSCLCSTLLTNELHFGLCRSLLTNELLSGLCSTLLTIELYADLCSRLLTIELSFYYLLYSTLLIHELILVSAEFLWPINLITMYCNKLVLTFEVCSPLNSLLVCIVPEIKELCSWTL